MFCAASLCQDNSSESSPIMRDEVGHHALHGTGSETIPTYSISPDPSDYEVNTCRFGFSSSHRFSMGFRLGTVMAMAKALFCGQWTIFVLILRCASDHWHAGRSNHSPFYAYWRGLMIVHDTMSPNKMCRAFGRKTAPQHQRSATILHSGYEVLFCMAIFLSTPGVGN